MSNRIHDAFDQVKADSSIRQKTTDFLKQQIQPKPRRLYRPIAAFACILLVAMIGYRLYSTETYSISVDINPSIEMGLNCFDRVVSVRAFNDDGTYIADTVSVKNKSYTDAVKLLMASDSVADYVTDDSLISFTVVADNHHEQRLIDGIQTYAGCENRHVAYNTSSQEEMQKAHDSNLSVGKYRAYMQLVKLQPQITIDDIRTMSMREIQDKIDESGGQSDLTAHMQNDCQNMQGGGGMGNGRNGNGHKRHGHEE